MPVNRKHTHRIRAAVLIALSQVAFAATNACAQPATSRTSAADSLPARLSDAEYWRLVGQISELEGFFQSDNFTSNEIEVGPLSALLRTQGKTGGVYMGVGPEQNFSYIAAIRPKMAFVVDIRRQAMVQHLMYKAIFELSATRADFLSMLFSKPRPPGIDTSASIQRIWSAFTPVGSDASVYTRNLARIRENITGTHKFTLTSEELGMLEYVYESFFSYGPSIGSRGRAGGGGRGGSTSFFSLTQATGPDGSVQTFLANEENYRVLKDLHSRNMIVAVSGDFGGPRAIREIGKYVASKGAKITAFYLSNVEQYLFQDNKSRQFYMNVATLPVDAGSVFIRPYAMRTYPIDYSLCPIADFLRAFNAGRVSTNNRALACGR